MYHFTDCNPSIDLRKEASELTSRYSISMLYIRTCKYVRCTCYNEVTNSGNPNCPNCFGSGFFSSIEKIAAIPSRNVAYSERSALRQTNIGITDRSKDIYYLTYDLQPKNGDFILKVTWDEHGYPVDLLTVNHIVQVYDMRMDNGRVELYGCETNLRTDLLQTFRSVLKRLPKEKLRILLKGGKYIWPYKLLPQKLDRN